MGRDELICRYVHLLAQSGDHARAYIQAHLRALTQAGVGVLPAVRTVVRTYGTEDTGESYDKDTDDVQR